MKHINDHTKEDMKFFREMFGFPLPSFSHLPNIVMPAYPKVLKYILRTISRKGCICFNEPPYDRTDCMYD
ncbi:MAG: hypothetical protein LBK06_03985, partial [Planctomycetaceae bacterium]|nr:hypothetical protein [Planctomycetaceae bacterium]